MKPLPRQDLDECLAHTSDLWKGVRGARLLMTGATGFMGSWLVETLVHADRALGLNLALTIVTRNRERALGQLAQLGTVPGVDVVEADVKAFVAPSGAYDLGVHLATEVPPGSGRGTVNAMLDSNLQGMNRFLEFVEERGVSRFLFTSSGAAYGKQPAGLEALSEDAGLAPDIGRPESAYGEGKRICELLCSAVSSSGRSAGMIARCFAFVGPNLPLDAGYAVGNFIRDAMTEKVIRINGDGTPFRSYLYAADLATWLWTILLKGRSGEIYNVGASQAISIRDLAGTVQRVLQSNAGIAVARQPEPGAIAQRYVPDNRKACEQLGLREWTSLESGIERTVNWLRS